MPPWTNTIACKGRHVKAKEKTSGETPNGIKADGKPMNQVFSLVKEIDTNQEGIDEYDQVLEE